MRSVQEKIGLFVLLITYLFVAIFLDLHKFSLWSQVLYLRGKNVDLLSIFSEPHALRYTLVYPIFAISDIFEIHADQIFSTVCFIMLFLTSLNCLNVSKHYVKKIGFLDTIFYGIFFLALSTFMNGRMAFSLLGFSYLMVAIHRWEFTRLSNFHLSIRVILALILCSVSTGTFLLCFLTIGVWLITIRIRSKKNLWIYFIVLTISLSQIIWMYLIKNVNFYGGGITGFVNMLNHGTGKIFYGLDQASLVLFIFILVFLTIFLVGFYLRSKRYQLLYTFVASSIIGGLFGYSTMFMGIIPGLILLRVFSLKTQIENFYKN